jgi:hypothetical protein
MALKLAREDSAGRRAKAAVLLKLEEAGLIKHWPAEPGQAPRIRVME